MLLAIVSYMAPIKTRRGTRNFRGLGLNPREWATQNFLKEDTTSEYCFPDSYVEKILLEVY